MNCQETDELKHAYIDGELELTRSVEIEKHIAHCDSCSRAYQGLRALRDAVRTSDLRFTAPLGLERRIRSAVRGERAEPERTEPFFSWARLKWGFSLAGTALAACILTAILLSGSPDNRLAQEVAASHIRSLMVNHLTDVASSDQHTVKPWFDGKVDFAPPVVNLSEQGFPLLGGRLDYLDGRQVAALVYQRQKHFINLFIWPAPAGSPEKNFTRNGYNLIHWNDGGMTFWAVSDLNRNELRDFEQLIKGQAAPATGNQGR